MKRAELLELKNEFGTVEHDAVEETIYLTQAPYADSSWRDGRDGALVYKSRGIDADGNTYHIEWDTTAEWDAHQNNPEHELHQGEDTCSWCEDESNACDWDSPSIVEAA